MRTIPRSVPRPPRPWLVPTLIGGVGLVLAILLAASAFGQARLASLEPMAAVAPADAEEQLDAGVPPPERVFVQRTSVFPGRGNVLVSVQLSDAQRATKDAEGTGSFITIGDEGEEVILRDDGRGGDEVGGDGLFTGIATVDQAELDERAEDDRAALEANRSTENPVFFGRSFGGTVTVEPFDLAGFNAGNRVPLDTAIVTVDASTGTAEPADSVATRSGARLVSIGEAAAAPKNCTSVPTPSPGVTGLFQDRVLMIRHPKVVEDPLRTVNPCTGAGNPNGVWTFKHLMTEMATASVSGIDPADFVEQWLLTWTQNPGPSINNHTVSTRLVMQKIIDQWRADSGGGKLDLSLAPFRLSAIVPRLDLRTTDGGGGGYGGRLTGKFLDGGEARFVFGVVLKPHWDMTGFALGPDLGGGCRALPFTVIFEYRVPKCDCPDVRAWARQWVSLAGLTPGTAAYNGRLERITDQFTRADADPRRPNGSAIGQIRTNEIALRQDAPPHVPSFVWELREFQLTQKPFSFLQETTTADTPQDRFNDQSPHFGGSILLFDWITGPVQNALVANNDCAAPIPPVPLLFQGSLPASDNFLGANPHVPSPAYHWDHLNLSHAFPFENWARHRVSLAACSGCHAGETSTVFLQIDPQVPFGAPASIAGFLSGINNVADPADPASFPDRHFDDLLRREVDIKKVAKMRCVRFHPVDLDHVRRELEATGALPDDLFGDSPVLPADLQVSASADDMRRNPVAEKH